MRNYYMNRALITSIFCLYILGCSNNIANNYPDCSSVDIEKMDTCLISLTIKQAINKLHIDTSQFLPYFEDAYLGGIQIVIKDSCAITLISESVNVDDIDLPRNFRLWYLYIIDKKIIGVEWQKKNKSRYIFPKF